MHNRAASPHPQLYQTDQAKDVPLPVEIAGVFGSNANLHTPQTPYEVTYPGTVSARPQEEQIHLNDLDVIHDPDNNRLCLVSRRLQREVRLSGRFFAASHVPLSASPLRARNDWMDLTNAKWHNVAVYYYEEDKDQLILNGIRPLFRSIAPVVGRAFFVRHWLRGPHLRLRFFTTDAQFTQVVKPAIEEQIGNYLRECPSTTRLDEEKLRPVYQKLAENEQEKGPVRSSLVGTHEALLGGRCASHRSKSA